MAAAEVLQPSHDRDRFFRITTLLIRGGTKIIRGLFDSIHHPLNLAIILQRHSGTLRNLRPRRILTSVQLDRLFPSPTCYGKSEDFDLTLLFVLLRNICNLTTPSTGWDELPPPTDLSLEADIARLKYRRNETFAHNNEIELSEKEFNDYWEEIKGACLRIKEGISSDEEYREWEEQIERCRNGLITEDDVQTYLSEFAPVVTMRVTNEESGSETAWNLYLKCVTEDCEGHHSVLSNAIQISVSRIPGITVDVIREGSIEIELRVKDLAALEKFWKRYQSGELANGLEKVLITENMQKLGEKVKLKVTVSDDEYLRARRLLEKLQPYKEKAAGKTDVLGEKIHKEAKQVQELSSQRMEETHSKREKTEEMSLPGDSGVVIQKGKTDVPVQGLPSPEQLTLPGDSGFVTPKEDYVSIPEPSWFQVTKESANYFKLCKLLIDGGTRALRDVFDSIHPPDSLSHTLMNRGNINILRKLLSIRILSRKQWAKLYPVVGGPADSQAFDMMLLLLLLRNICDLPRPAEGWDDLPAPTSMNTVDDIVRIRYYRNMLIGDPKEAAVSDSEFSEYWDDITSVLVRLGGHQYQAETEKLKTGSLEPKEMLDIYKVLKALEPYEKKTTTEKLFKEEQKEEDKESGAQNLLGTKLPTETK